MGFNLKRQKLAAAAVVSGFALGAPFILQAPASAAVALNAVCEATEACMYQHTNFRGLVADFVISDNNYGNNNYPLTGTLLDNSVSSAKNRDANCDLYTYPNTGYNGVNQHIAPGGQRSNYDYINDSVSSHRFICP